MFNFKQICYPCFRILTYERKTWVDKLQEYLLIHLNNCTLFETVNDALLSRIRQCKSIEQLLLNFQILLQNFQRQQHFEFVLYIVNKLV